MRNQKGILSLCAVLLLSACATTQKQTFTRTGDALVDGKAAVAQAPAKDRVLWEYRTGLTAFRRGDIAEAERQFSDALLTIGNIYGNDKTAKKARSYFSEESKKTFLGEPYERVMAYFYRGIIYWMNGEPDNARACFRSAQIADSDTENREYANDWVLMDYLDGLATVKLNGDGSDALKRAEKSFRLGKLPEYTKNSNTMVFFEFGEGPTKYATGEYREELRIHEGRSTIRGAWFKVDNKAVRILPYDDLNYQATTRGGRVMDHILANKAVFKTTTDTIGNVGLIGGGVTAMTQRGVAQEVGLGLLAVGAISKIVAGAATPDADTRAWDNLPQYLSFLALDLPPGPHTAQIDFTDAAGNVLLSRTKKINFNVSSGSDTVLFVSDKNS
jgi:tetratricopeptide (TPR) repeat protein